MPRSHRRSRSGSRAGCDRWTLRLLHSSCMKRPNITARSRRSPHPTTGGTGTRRTWTPGARKHPGGGLRGRRALHGGGQARRRARPRERAFAAALEIPPAPCGSPTDSRRGVAMSIIEASPSDSSWDARWDIEAPCHQEVRLSQVLACGCRAKVGAVLARGPASGGRTRCARTRSTSQCAAGNRSRPVGRSVDGHPIP